MKAPIVVDVLKSYCDCITYTQGTVDEILVVLTLTESQLAIMVMSVVPHNLL